MNKKKKRLDSILLTDLGRRFIKNALVSGPNTCSRWPKAAELENGNDVWTEPLLVPDGPTGQIVRLGPVFITVTKNNNIKIIKLQF